MSPKVRPWALLIVLLSVFGLVAASCQSANGDDKRILKIESSLARVSGVATRVQTLGNSTSGDVESMKKTLTDLQTAIASVQQNIASIKGADPSLQKKVDDLSAKVTSLSSKVDSLSSKINGLDQRLTLLETRFNEHLRKCGSSC